MLHRFLLLGALLLSAYPAFSYAQSAPSSPTQPLQVGSLVERVPCAKHPDQSYSLYLPSYYSPKLTWPIIYSFDPAARGKIPVELQREAAERYGYILAASNNSKNGPWRDEAEAAEAMLEDTQAKLSLDLRRVYFAGFSGGARLAAQLAALCKCSAGVILNGAGFASGREPSKDAPFAVFSTVGTFDFNFQEVIPLEGKLAFAGFPHWLRTFDGSHEWAPAEVMAEALAWFRIQAMKAKLVPPDDVFIRVQFAQSEARANSFAQSHDSLNAFREYSQIVATYDGLLEVSSIRAKVDVIAREKSLKDALKQESRDFAEQAQLTAGISAALSAPAISATDPAASDPSATEQVRLLRERTEREKQPQKALVLKRALAAVFIEAMEFGNAATDHKDYPLAIRAYRSAAEANPQSAWAWQSLAAAEASINARKETLNALQHARGLAKDKSQFTEWLNHQSAFDRYRASPEFQSLVE
jgi:dienelactone hydrolase